MDKKELRVISKELKAASKMHKGQAGRIDRMLKKITNGSKGKNKKK